MDQIEEDNDSPQTEREVATHRGMIKRQGSSGEYPMVSEQAEAVAQTETKQISANPRYETVFLGLKLNTSSSIVEPIQFYLRRVLYAAVIVFMPHMPKYGLGALLAICTFSLLFTAIQKPWKDSVV